MTEPETVTQKPMPFRLVDLLEGWEADAQAAHEAYTTGMARGPVTALPTLDRAIGGFLAPGLHILHGAPGTGKTALALQIAGTCGCPAVYVTCEMSPLELLRRVTARVTGTFLGRFKTGELPPQASMALARRAVAAVPDLWLMDATSCYPYRADMETVVRAARGDARHALVVVDSVHSWALAAPGGLPEYEALNAHLQSLNAMALALDCPVLAVAERNRASMVKGGMSAGAGTRKLEYGAWTVLSLQGSDGEDEAAPSDKDEIPVTLKIQKNRSGVGGKKIRMVFQKPTMTLHEDGWQPGD